MIAGKDPPDTGAPMANAAGVAHLALDAPTGAAMRVALQVALECGQAAPVDPTI